MKASVKTEQVESNEQRFEILTHKKQYKSQNPVHPCLEALSTQSTRMEGTREISVYAVSRKPLHLKALSPTPRIRKPLMKLGVRIRGTLGDINPLNKVHFKRARNSVQKGPL